MQHTTIPPVKWAQRKDKLWLTIDVTNVNEISFNITAEGKLIFSGKSDKEYQLEIEFYGEVNREESKFSNDGRNVVLIVMKKEKGPYWPRLLKAPGKQQWLNVDWSRYIDEDEEDEANNDFKGNFNPMNMMGGMGGMPGMPGMDDMGAFGGDDDEDDKPTEHEHGDNCNHDAKPSETRKGDLGDLDAELDVNKNK